MVMRAGKPETNFNNRPHSIRVLSPERMCVVYAMVDEAADDAEANVAAKGLAGLSTTAADGHAPPQSTE